MCKNWQKVLLYFLYCNNVVFNTTGEHTWQSVTRLFRYSREDLPYRNTWKKPQYQNDVCQGGKEKKECPRECPFAGSFSRGAYFTAKRKVFSNIVPKLLQSFMESAYANLVSSAYRYLWVENADVCFHFITTYDSCKVLKSQQTLWWVHWSIFILDRVWRQNAVHVSPGGEISFAYTDRQE